MSEWEYTPNTNKEAKQPPIEIIDKAIDVLYRLSGIVDELGIKIEQNEYGRLMEMSLDDFDNDGFWKQ